MVLRPGCRLYVPPGGLLVDSSRPREFPVTVEASLGAICYGARTRGRRPCGGDTSRRRSLEGRHCASRGPRDTPLRSPSIIAAPRCPLDALHSQLRGQVPGAVRRFRYRAGARGAVVLFAARRSAVSAARLPLRAVTRHGQHRGPLLRHDCGPPTHWYRAQTMNSPVA